MFFNVHCEWVFAAKDAPGGPYRFLERLNGLADMVERGAVALGRREPESIDPPSPCPAEPC